MLQKNPADRPNWNEIKKHEFFSEVNWEKLQKLQYETPNVEFFEDIEYY